MLAPQFAGSLACWRLSWRQPVVSGRVSWSVVSGATGGKSVLPDGAKVTVRGAHTCAATGRHHPAGGTTRTLSKCQGSSEGRGGPRLPRRGFLRGPPPSSEDHNDARQPPPSSRTDHPTWRQKVPRGSSHSLQGETSWFEGLF